MPTVSTASNNSILKLGSDNFLKAREHFVSNIRPYIECPTHETNMNEFFLVK